MSERVGIDTGGTFTDAVISDGKGGWRIHKRPTTPRTPALAVLDALHHLIPIGESAVELVHGSTHATNALLTGKLGRVCFLTTKGHRDILAIGRQQRDQLYALEPRPPRPAQPRNLIVEVDERLDSGGKTVRKLEDREVERVVKAVVAKRPQVVAVCLLHAWQQPRHERKLGRALRKLGIQVVLSCDLAPEQREYERATTTWADAGLRPVVAPALGVIADALEYGWGKNSKLRIMRSDGGTCSAAAAAKEPVHLALSGPAGGLSAARTLADARGDRTILTLDMGGTSTDVALLSAGELPLEELELAGLPLLVRGLPLHTVGTGGGSLARFDPAGALQVGPSSAGAEPGPACYGRGGEGVTITDAHLLVGRLHPRRFLDGSHPLDLAAARAAVDKLGVSPIDLLEIASADMERALRRVSLADGHDPRTLKLYAFGGAGGLHAAWMAARLGMPEVVIPPFPGAFSALGLLSAPPRRNLVRTVLAALPSFNSRRRMFRPLVTRARAELMAEGVSSSRIRIRRLLELRSSGQSAVFPLVEGPKLLERFHRAHRKRFGYSRPGEEVILVAVRVQADGPAGSFWSKRRGRRHRPFALEALPAVFPESGSHRFRRSKWYQREHLKIGAEIRGPALIAEYSATTVVPPKWRARVDGFGCLSLSPVDSK